MTTPSAAMTDKLITVRRLSHAVAAWAVRTPERPAISDDATTWTYAMLAEAVVEGVELLKKNAIRSGDRILLIGENSLSLAALILAAGEMDVWAVLENARRAPQEVDAIQGHCEARRAFYLRENSADAAAHAARHGAQPCSTNRLRGVAIGAINHCSQPEPVQEAADAQVGFIIYTTGTTGIPKGVMLTHGNMLFLAQMMVKLRKMTPLDRVYGVLPITHVMGLAAVLCGSLFSGAHVYLVPRFRPSDCVDALRTRGITILQGAPAMFAKLVDHAKETGLEATTLRFIAAGGAPIDPTVKQEVEALFGLTLHNGYGLTEGSGLCWTRLEKPRKDCSVGLPLPGVALRILDDRGNEFPSGSTGILWARGPSVMKGYFRAPDLTSKVLRDDGWFNTEDLAYIDQDGHVFIAGRAKDLIVSSGFNVYPLEVENALNAHPHIVYSAVVGRPTGANEEIVAFIELAPGKTVTMNELSAFLAERISPYKRPREVFSVAQLPVSANGKVLKHSLKNLAENFNDVEKPGITRVR